MNPFKSRDIISITDFTKDDLIWLFEKTNDIINKFSKYKNSLSGQILGYAFFEPSTRTRLSFEAAMKRLGGKTLGFSQPSITSVKKGESFKDTLRMLDLYSDVIVIRHPYDGAAKLAMEICDNPVISGGDGKFQHPTQTMLDIYTIYREFGSIESLTIGVMGDLKYARTINSLLLGFTLFRPRKIILIAPSLLRPRRFILDYLEATHTKYEMLCSLEDVISELDLLYVVRIQKERFPDPAEYQKIKGSYKVTLDILENAKSHFRILHPLPKLDEIDTRIDETKYALYYKQAKYGVYVRMALLHSILS